jgi:hypothetical protein
VFAIKVHFETIDFINNMNLVHHFPSLVTLRLTCYGRELIVAALSPAPEWTFDDGNIVATARLRRWGIEDQASREARRPRTAIARSILLLQGKPQLRRM